MIVMHISQLSNFQLCINCNCLPYLFLCTLSPHNLTSLVWNCVIIYFCCVSYHTVTCNVIYTAVNTLAFKLSIAFNSLLSSFQAFNSISVVLSMAFLTSAHTQTKHELFKKGENLEKHGSSFYQDRNQ